MKYTVDVVIEMKETIEVDAESKTQALQKIDESRTGIMSLVENPYFIRIKDVKITESD